ncbi:MAG: FkbM family methyltransferase [Terriglobales bacterium]
MAREVTVSRNGVLYRLDLRDDVQREIYFDIYERSEVRGALLLVPNGGICLDAGANNGAFALQFAKQVGPKGLVHAFEPDFTVWSRLKENCLLNSFENRLYCHHLALTNRNGTAVFYKSDSVHSGWGSLAEFRDIAVQMETVKVTTLDDFLAGENLSRVDLLKVDVEAHEPELLEGARASLQHHVFRYILIEFNGQRLKERGKTLNDFLHPLMAAGYKVVRPTSERLEDMTTGAVPIESVLINFLFAAP